MELANAELTEEISNEFGMSKSEGDGFEMDESEMSESKGDGFEVDESKMSEAEGIKEKLEKFEEKRRIHRKAIKEMAFELEDLDEFHQKIAMKIGIELYREVVKLCGGGNVYFPQYSKLVERKKKEYVYNVFIDSDSDYNITANYCGVSISTVRRYVREYKKVLYDKRRRKLLEEKEKQEEMNKNKK